MSDDRGSAWWAADRALALTATVWTGLNLAGLAAVVGIQPESLRSLPLAVGCLAASALAWPLIAAHNRLAAREVAARVFVVVLALSGSVVVLDTTAQALNDTYSPAFTWVSLSAIAAALLLPGRAGQYAVAAVAAATLVCMLAVLVVGGGVADAWHVAVLGAASALAYGMAVAAAANALRNVATTDDLAAIQRLEAEREAAQVHARAVESFRVARELHDTIINTLGAVRMGVDVENIPTLRRRCESDLDRLRAAGGVAVSPEGVMAEPGDTPSILAAYAESRARSLGLELTTITSGEVPELPRPVLEAVCGAVDEALLNTRKHADIRSAQLLLKGSGGAFAATVSDEGRGFSSEPKSGGGIALSIRERCGDAGVAVDVASRPGVGTSVRLVWSADQLKPPAEAPGTPAVGTLATALVPVAAVITAWLVGLSFIEAALGLAWGRASWSVLALLLVTGASLLAVSAARRTYPIQWPSSLLLVACVGLVGYLPSLGDIGCERVGWPWWGPVGSELILVLLALLSRSRAWLVAGSLTYTGAMVLLSAEVRADPGQCASDVLVILVPEAIAVVAIVLFRLAVTRFGAVADLSIQRRTIAMVVAQQEEARQLVGQKRLRPGLTQAANLLVGIRDGHLDPTDQQVRADAADYEALLRTLIRVDTKLGSLEDVFILAILRAHDDGIRLRVGATEPIASPSPDTVTEIAEMIHRCTRRLPHGSEATISAISAKTGGCVLLVTPTQPEPVPADELRTLVVTRDDTPDQTVVELCWQTGDTSHGPLRARR